MTTYYEVLRSVTSADLDTRPAFAKVLKAIPPEGQVTFEEIRRLGLDRASKAVAHACSLGILRRISPCKEIQKLDSVKFWSTQLNDSGFKNTKGMASTRESYLRALYRFNGWLHGRSFPSYETVVSEGQARRRGITKSFASTEELMNYCDESDHGTRAAQRVIREYLSDPEAGRATNSEQILARSAIKSYFGVHDIVLNLPKTRKKRSDLTVSDDAIMTLEDFYKLIQNGNPNITMRTIMMIKFQSGMDSSTLTDRFNYEGYDQIAKHFKTDDYSRWDVGMCPVPLRLIRVKTGVEYTTFIDRDAITQLQEYLAWKEANYGRHDTPKPLFLTKQRNPIYPIWVSNGFSKVAIRAGIQKKISHKMYKIRAHEVRDLLKSTLLAAGCLQYAAEQVLGHATRDTHTKDEKLV